MRQLVGTSDLDVFVRVARTGSFARAASELGIIQSGLSRQIRRLEEKLGTDLLVRHSRGVRTTEAGRLFLERAEAIMQQLQQLIDEIGAQQGGFAGEIALGLEPGIGNQILPAVLPRVRNLWPRASLRIREGSSGALESAVIGHQVDIAVVYDATALEALDVLPVLTDPMLLVGTPRAIAAIGQAAVKPLDLARLPLVLPGAEHVATRLVSQLARRYGVRLQTIMELDSLPLLKGTVAQGVGYTIMPHSAVRDEVARGELQVLPIARFPLASDLSVISAPGERRGHLAEIRRVLREVIVAQVRNGAWPHAVILDGKELPQRAA